MSTSEIWQAQPATEQVLREIWEEERLAGRKREYLKKVSSHGLKAARKWLAEEQEFDRVKVELSAVKPQYIEVAVVEEEPPPRPKKLRRQGYGHHLARALDALYATGIFRPTARQVMKWWQDNPMLGLEVHPNLERFTYVNSAGVTRGVDIDSLQEAIRRRFTAS